MNKVNGYIQSIPGHRRDRFLSIHNLILKILPYVSVDVSYKMPTYRLGNGWGALANQKTIFRFILVLHHTSNHTNNNTRRKWLYYYRDGDEIRYDDLEPVIRHAIEHAKPESDNMRTIKT